jgi:nucleoside-diphosphate-sugar epimerase
VNLFGRTFRYEERAAIAIQQAKRRWAHIEDVVAALEWAIMHDPLVGTLLSETGLRGFVSRREINQ